MEDTPWFHGIFDSDPPVRKLWEGDLLPKALSAALVNLMDDREMDTNLVRTDAYGVCRAGTMPPGELMCRDWPDRRRFLFDSVSRTYSAMVADPPSTDLVVLDYRRDEARRLQTLLSVVPDATTTGEDDRRMGPEVTVRTPMLVNCALSLAASLSSVPDEALEVLRSGVPDAVDWSSWEEVSGSTDAIASSLDNLERRFADLQSPFLLQAVWKSEDDGPYMSEDAMDAFVWSDFAFTRLFLDSGMRPGRGGAGRMQRAAVRTYRILASALAGERPEIGGILDGTSYGIQGNKEFMVNGRNTNRMLACDNLTRPRLSRSDVGMLASEGFVEMVRPDRDLRAAVYHALRFG